MDLEKFNAQNPELEKAPTKKPEQVKKEKFMFENKKNKIIDQPILSDEEVKKIMRDFDNH